MDVSFERAISLYDFPSGRRLHALSETAAVTKREDFKQLSDLLDDAVPHERSTYKLSAQWRQARLERTPRFGAEAVNLDRRIDSALAAADRVLEGHQAAAESAEADSIEALRDELFPGGVLSSIRLSFIEALAELERILQLIDGKHKARLKELALEWLAVRVRPLYESFRAVVREHKEAALDYGELRAALAKGQNYLLRAVACVYGCYNSDSADDIAARKRFLHEIFKQNDAIAKHRRGRRSVPDIDPETGEEEPVDLDDEPELSDTER